MKKTAQPYNLFKDPTQPVRVCRCCAQELQHLPWCEFVPVNGARTTVGWVSWVVPTPVLEAHLTPLPVPQPEREAQDA